VSKYLHIIKITFEEYFEYRLNFFLWRFRNFISFITLFFFWLAIYGEREILFDYQRSQMLVYIIGVSFLRSIVVASRSVDLAGQIRKGDLTKLLLQPINLGNFWLTRDLADKSLNLFFTIFEVGLVIKLFKIDLFFPKNWETYLFFLISVASALILYFFISFLLSISAFWTDDVWSIRWLFGIIFLEFFSGGFFPIDILPKWLVTIINLTPFPYLIYFPLKIWLEQVSGIQIFKALSICWLWLLFFIFFSKFAWNKGSKNYSAYGG